MLRLRKCILFFLAAFAPLAAARVEAQTSLADLLAGGSIQAGNNIYSNWQLNDLQLIGGAVANLTNVIVDPIADDPTRLRLLFSAPGRTLSTSAIHEGASSLLLKFSFDAQTVNSLPLLSGTSVEILARNMFARPQAVIRIIEDLPNVTDAELTQAVAIVQTDDPFGVPSQLAELSFGPRSSLHVEMRIDVAGQLQNDDVQLNSFELRFLQAVPEPNGLILAAWCILWTLSRGARRRHSG